MATTLNIDYVIRLVDTLEWRELMSSCNLKESCSRDKATPMMKRIFGCGDIIETVTIEPAKPTGFGFHEEGGRLYASLSFGNLGKFGYYFQTEPGSSVWAQDKSSSWHFSDVPEKVDLYKEIKKWI